MNNYNRCTRTKGSITSVWIYVQNYINFFTLQCDSNGWLRPNSKLFHFAKVSIDYPKNIFHKFNCQKYNFLHILSEKITYLMNSLQDDAV